MAAEEKAAAAEMIIEKKAEEEEEEVAAEEEESAELFKWGKKRGIGGKKRDVQFYANFTYDGVDYKLFDNVYLNKEGEGEPEPHIGKIIKIWETGNAARKIKVQWFFRPREIRNFLNGYHRRNEIRENELFLASGDGKGFANINPVEAIAGKCNVICISKDSRNRQPSDEEVKMADFVFQHFFDVGLRKISDEVDDKIGGIDVKKMFNK